MKTFYVFQMVSCGELCMVLRLHSFLSYGSYVWIARSTSTC